MPDLRNLATTLFQALMVSCLSGTTGNECPQEVLPFHLIGGMTLPLSRESRLRQLIQPGSIWILIPNIGTLTCRAFNLVLNGAIKIYALLYAMDIITNYGRLHKNGHLEPLAQASGQHPVIPLRFTLSTPQSLAHTLCATLNGTRVDDLSSWWSQPLQTRCCWTLDHICLVISLDHIVLDPSTSNISNPSNATIVFRFALELELLFFCRGSMGHTWLVDSECLTNTPKRNIICFHKSTIANHENDLHGLS